MGRRAVVAHENAARGGKAQERLNGLHEVVPVDDVGRARLIEMRDDGDAASFQLIGQRSPRRGVHRDVMSARVQAESQIASNNFCSGAPRECDVSE